MHQFNNVLFNERYLSNPPSNKQGLNANETNFAADCASMIAATDLILGSFGWLSDDDDATIFQGFKANYSYQPNKLGGYIVGTDGNLRPTELATNRLTANMVKAGSYGVNVLPTGYAGNQRPAAWVKPGVAGQPLRNNMALYIKVPTAGMPLSDLITVYAFALGRPSDNTFIYTGYTLAQLMSNVFDTDLGKLLQIKANASNLANLVDNNA